MNPDTGEMAIIDCSGEVEYVPGDNDDDRMDWIREMRDQCIEQGVAHWFKQWGGPTPKSGGRTLDGRTWGNVLEFPTPEERERDRKAKRFASEVEARAAGFKPLTDGEAGELRGMNRKQRRAWAKQNRLAQR